MTTFPSKVCNLHGDGQIVLFPDEQPCPLCIQIERYERLKKQYLQAKDELEMAERPVRD